MGLYEDLIQNHDAKLIAGGAAQNTARGAQVWEFSLSLVIWPNVIAGLDTWGVFFFFYGGYNH